MISLNPIEVIYFDLIDDLITLKSFEEWIYQSEMLEKILDEKDYIELISLSYESKHVRAEIKKILDKYVSYSKYETNKMITLLNEALRRPANINEILEKIYYLYCKGYGFLQDLALGYGLTCATPYEYADHWHELDKEKAL